MQSFHGKQELKSQMIAALQEELDGVTHATDSVLAYEFMAEVIDVPVALLQSLADLTKCLGGQAQCKATIEFLEAVPVGVDLSAASIIWGKMQRAAKPSELREFRLHLLNVLLRKSAGVGEQLEAARA
jgi:hypothetical protein